MQEILEKLSKVFQDGSYVFLEVIFIVVFGFIAVTLFTKILKRSLIISTIDNMVINLVLKFVNYGLKSLILLFALRKLGFSLTSILVAFSAISLAIGLAVQDTLSNFANGLVLIATKPFKVGDYVEIGNESGYVKQIRFMNTVIDSIDNRQIIIPNKTVFNNEIRNYNANPTRMVEIIFSIDYDTDVNLAKKLILSVIKKNPKIMNAPEPLVRLVEHDKSSLNIRTRVWVENSDFWPIKYYLLEEVLGAFRKHNINIPFNQLVVSYRNQDDNSKEKINE